jgi:hypothetical protein
MCRSEIVVVNLMVASQIPVLGCHTGDIQSRHTDDDRLSHTDNRFRHMFTMNPVINYPQLPALSD